MVGPAIVLHLFCLYTVRAYVLGDWCFVSQPGAGRTYLLNNAYGCVEAYKRVRLKDGVGREFLTPCGGNMTSVLFTSLPSVEGGWVELEASAVNRLVVNECIGMLGQPCSYVDSQRFESMCGLGERRRVVVLGRRSPAAPFRLTTVFAPGDCQCFIRPR